MNWNSTGINYLGPIGASQEIEIIALILTKRISFTLNYC